MLPMQSKRMRNHPRSDQPAQPDRGEFLLRQFRCPLQGEIVHRVRSSHLNCPGISKLPVLKGDLQASPCQCHKTMTSHGLMRKGPPLTIWQLVKKIYQLMKCQHRLPRSTRNFGFHQDRTKVNTRRPRGKIPLSRCTFRSRSVRNRTLRTKESETGQDRCYVEGVAEGNERGEAVP